MLENVIWIKNLKADINNVSKYCFEMEKYIDNLKQRTEKTYKVYASIIEQFSNALSAIVLLMDSNFESPCELNTSKMNNISGIFILLRKMIEANILLNIILNYGGSLYDEYLYQENIDESHIADKFKNTCNYFHINHIDIKDKYYWISNTFGRKIISIDNLIDLARLVPEAKANLKAWAKECNYMSHPTLYSDDKILELYNGNFILELQYVFEVILEMMGVFYTMIESIEKEPLLTTKYQINAIEKSIPKLNIFKITFFKVDETINTNIDNFKKVDFNQIPYNIRAEYSMLNIALTAPLLTNGLGERQKRTLGKLIDILAEDLRDLLIGYYHKNNLVFYPKIRQVLEDLAYIERILEMNEQEIEIFQCYTDIQRYIKASYLASLNNKINNKKIDFRNDLIFVKDEKITVEQYYKDNLKFLKEYFMTKYNLKVKSDFIKRINSWAFDGVCIPTNWQLIKSMIDNTDSKWIQNSNYYSGTYSLSSTFCHVNNFSLNNENVNTNIFYVEILQAVMNIVRFNFEKLKKFAPLDIQKIVPEKELAINKILYNLYNHDRI